MNREINPLKVRVWQDIETIGLCHTTIDLTDKNTVVMYVNEFEDFLRIDRFIGLHDSAGKPIFEGDLLIIDNHEKYPVKVEFHHGMFGWWDYIDDEKEFTVVAGWEPETRLKIIGNVWQHPHLLESKE